MIYPLQSLLFLTCGTACSGPPGSTPPIPSPPEAEPILVTRVLLPPIAPNNGNGSCTPLVNPRRTGCIGKISDLQSGSFMPDDAHILAVVNFTGAPAAPDPASIYQNRQLIVIKTDNKTFDNGDPWRCITCGASEENTMGRNQAMDYPYAFNDGKRAIVGPNIVECPDGLTSPSCGPESVRIYPIRWDSTTDRHAPGGSMRELRLHPDNEHIGFSSLFFNEAGIGQYSFFARLSFDPSPTFGEPLVPRYDAVDTSLLYSDKSPAGLVIDPDNSSQLILQSSVPTVGELRGFGRTGKEVTYLGAPVESCNIDVFAADLATGHVRRLTSHPEYVDPVDLSPDDKWSVVLDTRGTDRQMFLSGLRGIPPITDLLSTAAVSSVPTMGNKLTGKDWGSPAVVLSMPEWNGRADPRWSNDGTRIVYTEVLTAPPACGGLNPLPCYNSTEDGRRNERIMLAHLISRKKLSLPPVEPKADFIPWGTPFPPGAPFPKRTTLPTGDYTYNGRAFGWADVSVKSASGHVESVAVQYHNFSDDGLNLISGSESISRENPTPLEELLHWFCNLTQTGPDNGTKITSEDGFHLLINIDTNLFQANGTLVTTVNGREYHQPQNFT